MLDVYRPQISAEIKSSGTGGIGKCTTREYPQRWKDVGLNPECCQKKKTESVSATSLCLGPAALALL
ncbi:hypothetical protein Y1Q_0016161 [Alligator mississippiensis]|uniref:Uncharacterized protein n=1 Tax=Alligator mississippiensis TaxID=8496 RepID=A0A151P239_ALLMI|nr:hypothetical protein Y1Q_0016161 [Alligator mississippiensis]